MKNAMNNLYKLTAFLECPITRKPLKLKLNSGSLSGYIMNENEVSLFLKQRIKYPVQNGIPIFTTAAAEIGKVERKF